MAKLGYCTDVAPTRLACELGMAVCSLTTVADLTILRAPCHLAKRIGARIRLASKLYLYQLNHLTVQWLLDGFHLVLLPKDLAGQMYGL